VKLLFEKLTLPRESLYLPKSRGMPPEKLFMNKEMDCK